MLENKETDYLEDDNSNKQKTVIEKSQDRLAVLEKIEEAERAGKFDIDVEQDPPSVMLMPEEVDYLNEKISSKVKTKFANTVGKRFLDSIIKDNKLIIKEIKGIENLNKLESGAVITCNHFNPFDVFAIEKVFRLSELKKSKKLYKVIREGNYTNFPGLYGFFFRNCDTLPLSSNKDTMVEFMKSIDTILKKGDLILMYPEQSMWWNYRKPRPFKQGSFRIAARNGVPVVPILITMEDSDIVGDDGFPIQKYTINIGEAIIPDNKLSEKENSKIMMDKNYEYCKNIYESFYKTPLEFTTENEYLGQGRKLSG